MNWIRKVQRMTIPSNENKPNGDSTVHDWLMHIDCKITEGFDGIRNKIDTKADKEDVDKLEDKIEAVEKKTNRIELKMAGVAGIMATGVLGAKAAVLKILGM